MRVHLLSYGHRHGTDRHIFTVRKDAVSAAIDIMVDQREEFVEAINNSRSSMRHIVTAFDVLIRERNLPGAASLWLDILQEDISIESFDIIPKGGRP